MREQRLRELIAAVAPCWAGEALVGRRYLGGHRTRERDVRWIGFQAFKEFSGGGVYGGPGETVASILRAASQRASEIGLATPAHEIDAILGDLQFAVDELRHLTQFIRLYAMAGGAADRSLASLGELPSARRLAALRHELRATPVGHTAVSLSEGGGLGLHFGMREHYAAHPPASEIDVEIARVTEAILADESHHMLARFQAVSAQVRDERSWRDIEQSLVAICTQKLRERNEQFSFPLREDELEAIPADKALGERYTREHLGFLVAGL
ncbi:MAG TPA: hypothetical protein VMW19_04720 [Myxococcota bacterium]|nr:hypothetical protein [Myxococcota bacterium]